MLRGFEMPATWFSERMRPFPSGSSSNTRTGVGGGCTESSMEERVATEAEDRILGRRRAQVLEKLIGDAPPFVRVRDQLSRLSESEATVLISGETGTGKELMARALHYLSSKAGFPFVAVNCAALPDTLLED